MLSWSFALVIGLLTGILSGFGIGGGTILMIYLTAFAAFPQKIAQGINLLYFIPTAAAALILHSKHHQLKWNAVLPAALCGCATAAGFSFLAMGMNLMLLRRLFGVLLLYIGAKELFTKRKNSGTDPKPSSSNRVTRENHGGSPPRNP